nr:unnamed protein product [Callosobruchus analis]
MDSSDSTQLEGIEKLERLEQEAMQMGGIPRRQSLARTPPETAGRGRSGSCAGLFECRTQEDLNKSMWEIETQRNQEQRISEKITHISKKSKKEAAPSVEDTGKGRTTTGPSRKRRQSTEDGEKEKVTEPPVEVEVEDVGIGGNAAGASGEEEEEELLEVKKKISAIVKNCERVNGVTGRVNAGKFSFNVSDKVTVAACMTEITGMSVSLLNDFMSVWEKMKRAEQKRMEDRMDRIEKKVEGMLKVMKDGFDRMEKVTAVGTGTVVGTTVQGTQSAAQTTAPAPVQARAYAAVVGMGEKEVGITPARNRTYASLPTRPATTVTMRPPTWATPEKEEVYGTVVRMEGEEQDVWKVVQRVKKNLEGKVNNVKAVRKTAGGAVIIESKDRDQQKLIVESLKTDRELKVKGDGLIKPKLKVTGVTKGYKAEDIAKEILTQNEKLAEGLKDAEREIRLLRRIPCRNVVKENWIIETSPALFKRMAKQGTITFDLEVLYVEEQRDVALCFRCCKYGHMAKLCREESYCFVCGKKGHEGAQCPGGGVELHKLRETRSTGGS